MCTYNAYIAAHPGIQPERERETFGGRYAAERPRDLQRQN